MKEGLICIVIIAFVMVAVGFGGGSYWEGRADYALSDAAADAVRADTRAAHGFDARTLALVLLPLSTSIVLVTIFLSYLAKREAQMLKHFYAHELITEQVACLPESTYVLQVAPERENTYISVWAGGQAGDEK